MKIIKATDLQYKDRNTSIIDGTSKISWAVDSPTSKLMAGFGVSNGDETTFKTLEYEEVIYVVSGTFGAEVDGVLHQAEAGDVIHIAPGTSVRYISSNARILFVITNPDLS